MPYVSDSTDIFGITLDNFLSDTSLININIHLRYYGCEFMIPYMQIIYLSLT